MGADSLKLEGEVEGTAYLPAYDAGETAPVRDEFRRDASHTSKAMVVGVLYPQFHYGV